MLAFAAWCVYQLHGELARLDPAPILHAWDLVLLAGVLSLVNYAVRIIRWRAYLTRLGAKLPFRFAALTFTAGFAYTLSPGKVGELVRARYYVPLGIPLSKTAAAFFVERFLDMLALVVMAALLFTAFSHYEAMIIGGTVAAVGTLVALMVVPWSTASEALASTSRLPPVIRLPLAKVATTLAATRVLLRPGILSLGFSLALLAWMMEAVGFYLLSSMFPPAHLEAATAVGIYAFAVLIGGLSFLPGGLGSTEAVMTALVAARGYSLSQALLVTLACRLVTLWLAVVLGWGAVFALRRRSFAVVTPCP
jgi:glycosyltransferase 2 family protein